MNQESKLKLVFQSLLEVFDEFEVSAEDGVFLSANLFASSVELAKDHKKDSELSGEHYDLDSPAYFRQTELSVYSPFPPDRWGLDPSLLSEEN
jgi:hypothetical protein